MRASSNISVRNSDRPPDTWRDAVALRLFGPMTVTGEGVSVPITSIQQRTVLATLALQANQPVLLRRLERRMWTGHPPPTSIAVVRNTVAALRRVLRPVVGLRLETADKGYRLRADPMVIDCHVFKSFVDRARHTIVSGDYVGAACLLDSALAMWRTPAVFPTTDGEDVWTEALELGELRLCALETRIDVAFLLGSHREVTAKLERLVLEHPDREVLRRQHITALYRNDRQVEALAACQRVYADFERLGRTPSQEMQVLHRAILEQRDAPPLGPARPAQHAASFLSDEWAPVAVLCVYSSNTEPAECPEGVVGSTVDTLEVVDEYFDLKQRVAIRRLGRFDVVVVRMTRKPDLHRLVLAATKICRLLPGRTVAVDCGDALIRHGGSGRERTVIGAALDRCRTLVETMPTGSVHVSDDVRTATSRHFVYDRSGSAWALRGHADDVPYSTEAHLLDVAVRRTWSSREPHLVVLTGRPGEVSRLVQALSSHSARTSSTVWLRASGQGFVADESDAYESHHTLEALNDLCAVVLPAGSDQEERVAAQVMWQEHLARLTETEPLILAVRDVHDAEERTLRFLATLPAMSGCMPVVCIVLDTFSMFARKSHWGTTCRNALAVSVA